MKPIRPIKFIPQKCLYKILDILTQSDLVWQILDQFISSNQDRAKYLCELLLAVMLCGDAKNGYAVHKCEDCGLRSTGFTVITT
jgi:hypothetical protein